METKALVLLLRYPSDTKKKSQLLIIYKRRALSQRPLMSSTRLQSIFFFIIIIIWNTFHLLSQSLSLSSFSLFLILQRFLEEKMNRGMVDFQSDSIVTTIQWINEMAGCFVIYLHGCSWTWLGAQNTASAKMTSEILFNGSNSIIIYFLFVFLSFHLFPSLYFLRPSDESRRGKIRQRAR